MNRSERPRQNRVDPWGAVVARTERGSLFGNRGVLHNDDGMIVRNNQVIRWIACELAFKGRRRPMLRPGRYTELFFLDEPTALAAGHRPCFECRRPEAGAFQEAFRVARSMTSPPTAGEMDAVLHEARIGSRPTVGVATLPSGSMVERDRQAWLVDGGRLRLWSHGGYGREDGAVGRAILLTPRPIIAAIEAGYVVRPPFAAA